MKGLIERLNYIKNWKCGGDSEMHKTLNDAISDLENLTPTQPEPQWIQVEDGLPEEDGEYLVWMQWDYEEHPTYSIIDYDSCAEQFGYWKEYYHPDTLGSLGTEFHEIKGVIAWQKLPDPPQERRTD